MIRKAPPKHPDSSKWYFLQWSSKELQNASITSSVWVLPADIVAEQESVVDLLVGVRLSGGVLESDYDVVNKITTSVGENIQVTMRLRIRATGH
ncbi:hypothetical protein JYT79_01685 [Cardiobacterium sp. AH-315-I02]|nr:hypothetical protein [Cardiobacterium sp. AH-315-I02]